MVSDNVNIILLIVDCLRKDFVSCLSDKHKGNTPHIDRIFGRQAVGFENCFSNGPQTLPSITSLMTSTFPLEYGGHSYLVQERRTMAEFFREVGYDTAAFHSNPTLCKERNFNKGFNYYKDDVLPPALALIRKLSEKNMLRIAGVFRRIRRMPSLPAADINKKAMKWIASRDRKFFLWIQYMDAHGPYYDRSKLFTWQERFASSKFFKKALKTPEKISEKEKQHIVNLYSKDIKYVDHHIGRILEWLDKRGILDKSVVILTADHGEEFGEHGQFDHSNKPYNELIRVPLFILMPDRMKRRVAKNVSLIDLFPTLIDMLNLESSDLKDQIRGTSFNRTLQGKDENENNIFVERDLGVGKRFAIISNRWKYIFDELDGKEELYDLKADPLEKSERSSKNRNIIEKFREILDSHFTLIKSTSSGVNLPEIQMDHEIRERLRDLGYLD